MALVLRGRRRRALPGDQHLGRHRGRAPASCRRIPSSRSSRCRSAVPRSGMAVDVYDDDGQAVARRGGRAGVHAAVAGHDARPVQRPRALPRDVLEPLARRVGARRLGVDRRRRRLVPARPQRRHHQGGGQAARSGRGRVGAREPPRGASRPRRSACPTRSRARRSGASWCSRPASRRTTRLRAELAALVAERLGKSFKPVGHAVHRCAARRRATPRCCAARSGRPRSATTRATSRRSKTRPRSTAVRAAHVTAHMTLRRPAATVLRGRRVVLRPLELVRLRGLARGATSVRRLAGEVGAQRRRPARPISPTTGRRSRRAAARGAASGSSAPATASASSSTTASPARSTSTACSAGRSRTPTSATGSTRPTRATATSPRRWWRSPASRSRTSACTACRSRSFPATPPAGASSRSSSLREEGVAVRYLEINGVWEDHVRYAITRRGVGRAPRGAAEHLDQVSAE